MHAEHTPRMTAGALTDVPVVPADALLGITPVTVPVYTVVLEEFLIVTSTLLGVVSPLRRATCSSDTMGVTVEAANDTLFGGAPAAGATTAIEMVGTDTATPVEDTSKFQVPGARHKDAVPLLSRVDVLVVWPVAVAVTVSPAALLPAESTVMVTETGTLTGASATVGAGGVDFAPVASGVPTVNEVAVAVHIELSTVGMNE